MQLPLKMNKILNKKTKEAMKQFLNKTQMKKSHFVIAGGVAANKSIRENLINLSKEMEVARFLS